MDSVVIPIQQPLARRDALRVGFSVARRAGAQVRLLSVGPDTERAAMQSALDEVADDFTRVAPCSTEVVEHGSPVDVLLDVARSEGTLLAMPTKARRGVSRAVFGSVAEEVVRGAARPILCVGPSARGVFLPGERVEGLVCTDDSTASGPVFDAAAEFASAIDARCTVVQVVGPDEDVALDGGPQPRPIRDRADEHCSEAAGRLATSGVDSDHRVLPGDPAGTIVQHAEAHGAGFVVVGTSGRTGLTRISVGSVATDVVRNAPCPVLVVPTLDPTA